jgi:dienelactone hydrolase
MLLRVLIVSLVVAGCRSVAPTSDAPGAPVATSSETPAAPPVASAPEATSVDAGKKLAPLSEDFVTLPVEGFKDAIVSVPTGATAPRPVVVALHGNYDRPEWQCEVWREITKGHPFVLCPRGIPRDDAPKSEDRWTYGAMGPTEKELERALEALAKRFGEHVDPGPIVYTGFSLGAIYGKLIARKNAKRFPRAVFVEGGYEGWALGNVREYAKGGGTRVLFACGQSACVHAGKQVARLLEKEGISSRVASGGNIGHTYDGPVASAVAAEWGWLNEGDPRFTPP